MNSTTKKIVYGLALLASSALFANELLKASRSDRSPAPIERSAEGDPQSEDFALASTSVDGASPSQLGDPELDPEALLDPAHDAHAPRADVGAVLDTLESALERMDSGRRLGAGMRRDVATRARKLRDERSAGSPDSLGAKSEPAVVARDVGLAARREEAELRARLQDFLAASPLTGVLRGEHDSAAMFGGRIVRVGDALLGDDGELLLIDEHGLVVSLSGRELRIEVPPVRSRPIETTTAAAGPAVAAPESPVLAGPELSNSPSPAPIEDPQ